MNTLTRRKALQEIGSAGVVGLSMSLFPSWMPRLAFGSANRGDTLVLISQRGGMDGLNVVVPFGEGAAYYDRRPTLAIPEPGKPNGAIDLNGFFGLHPSLAPLKAIYDSSQMAVIHAAGSPDPTRSHFEAMEFMDRGTPGSKTTLSGWVNRHLQTAAWQNGSPFRAVGIGALLPTALQGQATTLALKSITDFHLGGDDQGVANWLKTLSGLYATPTNDPILRAQASSTFEVIEILKKISAVEYKPANNATYPENEFGMALKQVAQMIKAEVGLEVACVDIGGWDTHERQGGAEGEMAGLLSNFALGLAAFYNDLREYMDRLTIVSMSEFGRRVEENASRGTDHGRGNCIFAIGGGINGGIHTEWPTLKAEALDDGDLQVTTDYRDLLAELLIKRINNPAIDQIFPNYRPTLRGITKG